jgi:hypothetical protein
MVRGSTPSTALIFGHYDLLDMRDAVTEAYESVEQG